MRVSGFGRDVIDFLQDCQVSKFILSEGFLELEWCNQMTFGFGTERGRVGTEGYQLAFVQELHDVVGVINGWVETIMPGLAQNEVVVELITHKEFDLIIVLM